MNSSELHDRLKNLVEESLKGEMEMHEIIGALECSKLAVYAAYTRLCDEEDEQEELES